LNAEGRTPSMQPLDSFPSWSLHCTVRLCQPLSQVLEHIIHAPVTHWGPGCGVEALGAEVGPGTRVEGAEEDVVVRVVVEVVVLVVVDVAVVLWEEVNFRTDGCCGAVHRGMKKL